MSSLKVSITTLIVGFLYCSSVFAQLEVCQKKLDLLKSSSVTTEQSFDFLNCYLHNEKVRTNDGKLYSIGFLKTCEKMTGPLKAFKKKLENGRSKGTQKLKAAIKKEGRRWSSEKCESAKKRKIKLGQFPDFAHTYEKLYTSWQLHACEHKMVIADKIIYEKKGEKIHPRSIVTIDQKLVDEITNSCSMDIKAQYQEKFVQMQKEFIPFEKELAKLEQLVSDGTKKCSKVVQDDRKALVARIKEYKDRLNDFKRVLNDGYFENICRRFETGSQKTYELIVKILNPTKLAFIWAIDGDQPTVNTARPIVEP